MYYFFWILDLLLIAFGIATGQVGYLIAATILAIALAIYIGIRPNADVDFSHYSPPDGSGYSDYEESSDSSSASSDD